MLNQCQIPSCIPCPRAEETILGTQTESSAPVVLFAESIEEVTHLTLMNSGY